MSLSTYSIGSAASNTTAADVLASNTLHPAMRTPQVRKYNRAQELLEVQSLTAAINKARANAISRGMQLAGATGNPIYDTFQFMDVDNRCVRAVSLCAPCMHLTSRLLVSASSMLATRHCDHRFAAVRCPRRRSVTPSLRWACSCPTRWWRRSCR